MTEQIGPYELFEKLGTGAMGTVYRARDTRTDTFVALTLLHPHLTDDPDSIARLTREARIAGQLSHPNIAGVLEQGRDGERFYIAMELVGGETLQQRLRREGRLSEMEAHRIALG